MTESERPLLSIRPEKHNLTRRVLMLMSVNYLPHENVILPLCAAYIAETLGEDEGPVSEECEFLHDIGVLNKDKDGLYSMAG